MRNYMSLVRHERSIRRLWGRVMVLEQNVRAIQRTSRAIEQPKIDLFSEMYVHGNEVRRLRDSVSRLEQMTKRVEPNE